MELEENGRLPFLEMEVMKNGCRLDTKVYKKPMDSGLLLYYHSHVDGRCKRSLLNTMLNRAFKLLIYMEVFFTRHVNAYHPPIHRLKSVWRLTYASISNQQEAPIRIMLPFKDQRSANAVRRQLGDLSRKVNEDISPVFKSQKIKDEIKVREDKPPLVNQQCTVHYVKCGLCDAGYVGYTCRKAVIAREWVVRLASHNLSKYSLWHATLRASVS